MSEFGSGLRIGAGIALAAFAVTIGSGVVRQQLDAAETGAPHQYTAPNIKQDTIEEIDGLEQKINEVIEQKVGALATAVPELKPSKEPKKRKKVVDQPLPSKIVGAYWQMYEGPTVAEITAEAPEYNLQSAAFALGNGNDGRVTFNPPEKFGANFAAEMHESQQNGCSWLLSLGGGVGDSQKIILNEQQHADQLVESLKPIIEQYGFNGIDFDLENGPEGWKPEHMVSAARQLKQEFGQDFIISMVPRPYEDYYFETAAAMGDDVDLVALQFYDNEITEDPAKLRDWIFSRVKVAVEQYGIPPEKILIGTIIHHPEYHLGSNSIEVYADIFKDLQKQYDGRIRGLFTWESSLDKKEGEDGDGSDESFPFAYTMDKVVNE